MFFVEAGIDPREVNDWTWSDAHLKWRHWFNTLEMERDVARHVMWAAGEWVKGTTPQRIWKLTIDKGNQEIVSKEEIAQKKTLALALAEERLKSVKGMQQTIYKDGKSKSKV